MGFFAGCRCISGSGWPVGAASAGIVLEGRSAPLSRIVIDHTTLQPVKVVSMLAMTRELALEPGAETLFVRELRNALGTACDSALIETLLSDTDATTISSSGSSPEAAVADVRAALLALGTVGDGARLVWLLAADVARKGSALGAEGGGVFPSLGPSGGEIRGVVAVTSAGIPAGSAVLLDCAQIAAGALQIDVQVAGAATLEMSDAPTAQLDHADRDQFGLDVPNEFACDARDRDDRCNQVARWGARTGDRH